MALTRASTLTDALNQLNDSLGYEESGLPMARDYREAVRWLIANRALKAGDASSMLQFGALEADLARVQAWIDARDTTRRQRFVVARTPR